jgi:hypothetical protein
MKTTRSLLTFLALASASSLVSCTTTQSPVHIAPAAPQPAKKIVRAPSAPQPDGALRQVPATPVAPPKPKVFPDIPLKEDTGVSPLIHTKPDTPTYKRSGS